MAALSSQIIMIVVAISVITISYVIFKLKARFAKGELKQEIIVDNLVVVSTLLHHSSGGGKSSLSGGSYSIRLKFIDIHSGKVIGQNTISRQFEIKMAVNGIIWLTLNRARYQKLADQELIALDVFSNKKVFDQDELKKKLCLAKDETINSMDLDSKTGHISVVSAAGFKYTFDCTTLQANGAAKTISIPSETISRDTALRNGHFYFQKIQNAVRYQLMYNKKTIGENQSFVNPISLYTINTTTPKEALVFFHQQDLDGQSASYISVAQSDNSKITELFALTPVEKKSIEVKTVGETDSCLFISLLNGKQDLVLAINKSTQEIAWIYKN